VCIGASIYYDYVCMYTIHMQSVYIVGSSGWVQYIHVSALALALDLVVADMVPGAGCGMMLQVHVQCNINPKKYYGTNVPP
jgi:hypothetical protein